MTAKFFDLILHIWRESALFWEYCLLVVLVYAVIFFFASFPVLFASLNFLMPSIIGALIIFVYKSVVGYRKWRRVARN